MDKEWWMVETASGSFPGGAPQCVNQEQAEALASDFACETSEPLAVVRYTRTEVKRFVRKITVTSEDMPSKA